MLLTTDHLTAIDELGGSIPATAPVQVASERKISIYRALARDGLARHMHGRTYGLTAEGRDAQRLFVSMLAVGYLGPREAMAPHWRFLDANILAAMDAATWNADRVTLADAPLLLVRGLAELREEPDDLRIYVGLNAYGKAWLDLANRIRKRAESAYGALATARFTHGILGTEAEPNLTPVQGHAGGAHRVESERSRE